MFNGIFKVPQPVNEPVLNYAPGSPERAESQGQAQDDARPADRRADDHRRQGGPQRHDRRDGLPARPPARRWASTTRRTQSYVEQAIDAANEAKKEWSGDAVGLAGDRACSRRPSCWPASIARRSTPPPCST